MYTCKKNMPAGKRKGGRSRGPPWGGVVGGGCGVGKSEIGLRVFTKKPYLGKPNRVNDECPLRKGIGIGKK